MQNGDNMPDARFTYMEGIPDEEIEAACVDFSSAGLKCESRKIDAPGPWMAHEWFIPTAIVLYITNPYLKSFLGEMGKDHYNLLKEVVPKLWKRFFGANTKVPEIAVISGRAIRNVEYTHTFSMTATSNDGRELKFMLAESINEEDFVTSAEAFLDFLCKHYRGDSEAVIPRHLNIKGIDDHLFVCLSRETREICFLDPLPKEVREKMAHNKAGSPDAKSRAAD